MARPSGYGPLLDALRGVSWPARRLARGASAGTHRSRLRGASPEFTEYRPYRQGDDPRRLDWKLLARTDRAFQRVTSDRATLGTLLIVDASASMRFPDGYGSKWECACRVAVGLAAVAHAAGDPVGVSVAAPAGAVALPLRSRRGVVGEIARLLERITPDGSVALAPLLALARPEWRVALIGDFMEDAATGSRLEEAATLPRIARERALAGGEVHAVHVVAREELEPPWGAVLARDPEAPAVERPLTEGTRAAYRERFAAWRAMLAREWLGAGAAYTQVVTDDPTERAVRRIVRSGTGPGPTSR